MSRDLADKLEPQSIHHDPNQGGLQLEDFELIDLPPWNSATRTSQAALWYKGALYVGTGRAMLGFMGRYTARQGSGLQDQGRFGSMRADTGGNDDEGAQIWRYDPTTREWKLLYDSPMVEGRDGTTRVRDRSIRAGGICQAKGDKEPVLYMGIGTLEYQCVFLRCEDGENFVECDEQGFGLGDEDVPSVRNIESVNGKLFSTPTGKNFGRGMFDDNLTDFPYVYETEDPLHGNWVPTCERAFGDETNLSINEIKVFEGHLYAATINKRKGFQIWKCKPEGKPPYKWTKIVENGAWRPISSVPSSMTVFNGALYVGCTLQRQGRGGRDRFGPFPAEMIRIHPDDSWDLVCGQPRFTPQGYKRPTSNRLGGLDDYFTHVFWRFAEQDGWLYLGTASWKWMPTYLKDRWDLSEEKYAWLEEETAKREEGEFRLWRTRDGDDWELVSDVGFPGGNPLNYGIREVVGTPLGLFVFPTCKAGANKGGGLEIWHGKKVSS
ncbi:MAG: hypothetical protein AAF184_06295 [Pseudomonadota bacterium]